MNTTPAPNLALWQDFYATRALKMDRRPLLEAGKPVFTMGSCFAGEIRKALVRANFKVYPDYQSVPFDRSEAIFDKFPDHLWISHYDTFVIRQEFESAFGLWPDRDDSAWEVREAVANQKLNSDVLYQDPGRKLIYATSRAALSALTSNITAAIREGIERSDLLVITMGLTEVWQHKATGRYLCRPPGTGYGGGIGKARFRQSTFVENYENMKAVFNMLFERYPNKQVVLTVSPVPLERTYTNVDVATANMESKSILRAVAGQICREYSSNVSYFPSYEMATTLGIPVFQENGRHVLPQFADQVIAGFMQAFA